VIAIATTDDEIAALQSSLRALDGEVIDVCSPGGDRRVVLAEVADGQTSERVAVLLRQRGLMAVTRPGSGAGLIAWQRSTAPVRFGDRLSVCLAWSEHDRTGLANLIELGPGGFGSGHHPTTRMIIEYLIEHLCGGESLLDVGCGSGIISLAAVALGAGRAVGVDVKPEAVAATSRNASLNRQDDKIEATDACLEEIDGSFDMVVANVARSGVVALAPQLVGHVGDGGQLVISGISPSQCDQVVGFLAPLVEVERRAEGDWAVVALHRPRAKRA
jgi:ribosomal protein L11 methyltransferase